jgi:hypothetical protein
VEGLCFSLSGRDGKAEFLRDGSGNGCGEFGEKSILEGMISFLLLDVFSGCDEL